MSLCQNYQKFNNANKEEEKEMNKKSSIDRLHLCVCVQAGLII